MSKQSLKMLGIVALLAIGVMYGVEMASSGIEQVNGPLTTSIEGGAQSGQTPAAANAETEPKAEPPQTEQQAEQQPVNQQPVEQQPVNQTPQQPQQLPAAGSDSEQAGGVYGLASKTGDLLQILSHHGIDLVVSVFDAIVE